MTHSSPDPVATVDGVAAARARVAALGKQWNGDVNRETLAVYTALQGSAERTGVQRLADLHYGAHPLQTFDLFVPGTGDARPVIVYLHGGGLVRGDKIAAGSQESIYSNVGYFFARHGLVALNANYRLVPEISWPAGQEDIRLLLGWIEANVGRYGGDARRVLLIGNSSGATHIATYLLDAGAQFPDGPRVSGALLSSGVFTADDSDATVRYFGADAATRVARSPLGLLDAYRGQAVPLFVWSGELDPPEIETSVAAFHSKLCRSYAAVPRYARFAGHNHVSHVMSLNSADHAVGAAALEFVHAVLGS